MSKEVREGGESGSMKSWWIVPLLFVPFLVSLFAAVALLIMFWTHEAPREAIFVIVLFGVIAVYWLRLLIKNLFEPTGGIVLTDVLVSTYKPRKRTVTLDSGYKYYALYVLIAYLLIPWFRKRENMEKSSPSGRMGSMPSLSKHPGLLDGTLTSSPLSMQMLILVTLVLTLTGFVVFWLKYSE
jgi:hypothetical protein